MNIKPTIVMKIKDFLASLFVFISLFLVACNDENPDNRTPDLPTKPIVILYENDVHCAVDGYPLLVSVREECQNATDYVSTVSCGDFASGGLVGAISQGGWSARQGSED